MIQSIETGRKEDGNRSIADKIIKRLHDLEMTVENNHGRWAWELLQNAKDSVADNDRKVSVEIELSNDRVVFRHNGTHFTEKDIRGLINQISSKEVEEGQESKQTGKFGTGFLTTHLLSKVIQVEGIVETVDEKYYCFSFPLDRNGKTTGQLVPKIENAWTAFHKSTEDNQITEYDENDFNTSFTYNLVTKGQKEIARIGVDEFNQLIPFVLAFIPVIDSVNIIDNIYNKTTKFENSNELENDVLLSIIKIENNNKLEIKLLFAGDDEVAIASIVEETKDGYAIQNLNDFPKLFCDFPLIGTEDFHFPLIVNSFYFNPLTERDGVWLRGEGKQEVEENRIILKKAVKLYGLLVEKVTALNFFNYYNICLSKIPSTNEKYFDAKWYQTNIQKSLREIITKSKVIETEDGNKVYIEAEDGGTVDFPFAEKKEDREKIWQLCSSPKYFILPKKEHIHIWHDLNWEKKYHLNEENILALIESIGNLQSFESEYPEINLIEWLNSVFDFTLKHQTNNKLFEVYSSIPNQEGIFKKRKELSSDEINDESLKKIGSLLGLNYYEKLIHKDVFFEESHTTTTIVDVATEITKLFNSIETSKISEYYININLTSKDKLIVFNKDEIFYDFSFDSTTNIYNIKSKNGDFYKIDSKFVNKPVYNKINFIRMLCEWFEENPENGELHFNTLYRRKEKLFVDTIEDKGSLYRVLKSTTPLLQLAEIAKTLEEDPEILNIIAKRKKEKKEEKERNEVGEKVEKILAIALQKQGFEVTKEIFGKDLVITLKKKNAKYAIEVKSTSRASFVSMTPFQVETAVVEAGRYALCVVQKNGSLVNSDFIRKNAKFVVDIGDRLHDKFEEVSEFETTKREIANTNDDIDLSYENNLDYKYKISSNIWRGGKSFVDFIKYISQI